MFDFLRNCGTVFQSSGIILNSHQQHENSGFSASLPALSGVLLYTVESFCLFEFAFPQVDNVFNTFSCLICRLYILLGEMSVSDILSNFTGLFLKL